MIHTRAAQSAARGFLQTIEPMKRTRFPGILLAALLLLAGGATLSAQVVALTNLPAVITTNSVGP